MGTKMTGEKKVTYSIAIGLMFCVMLYAFAVTWVAIPDTGKDNSKTILGFLLGSVLGTVVGVYFGTSKSSQDRNIMQVEKDAETGPPITEILQGTMTPSLEEKLKALRKKT